MLLRLKISSLCIALSYIPLKASAEEIILNGRGVVLGIAHGGLVNPDTYIAKGQGGRIDVDSVATDYSQDLPLSDWLWAELRGATALSGAKIYVSGVARDTMIDGGELIVKSKTLGSEDPAKITYFKEGDLALVTNTTLQNGGIGKISQKGTALNTNILDKGKLYVYDNGNARGTTVGSGGNMYVYDTTKVSDTIIKSGGIQWVYTPASDPGWVAQATGTVIEEGGIQYAYGSNNTVRDTTVYGKQQVYQGVKVINSNVYGGYLFAYNDAKVFDSSVFEGAQIYIETNGAGGPGVGAYGNNIQVKGGELLVRGISSKAENSVVTSGHIQALSGGKIIDTTATGADSEVLVGQTSSSTGRLDVSGGATATLVYGETSGSYAENINLVDQQSTLRLSHDSNVTPGVLNNVRIDNLVNNGRVQLSINPDPVDSTTYYNLSIGNLSGAGTFFLRTDIVGDGAGVNNVGDRVTVSGTSTGMHILDVANNGSADTDGSELLTVVETADGGATFRMNNAVELGGYQYKLRQNGNDWELFSSEEDEGNDEGSGGTLITSTANAGASFANATYLMNYIDTQTLMQRMGELRGTQGANNGDFWLRSFGGKVNSFSVGKLSRFDMSYSGVQAGVDRYLDVKGGHAYVGVMGGYTNGNPSYRNGDGKVRDYNIGLYSTYEMENGFYIDGIVKYVHMKNSFDVKDTTLRRINGKASSDGWGLSLEAGKRFKLNDSRFYIEPQAHLSYMRQGSSSTRSSNGLDIHLDSYDSLISRVGATLGYQIESAANPTHVYISANYLHEFKGKTAYTLNGSKEKHNFDGDWGEVAVGFNTQLRQRHNLYGEVGYTGGNRFDRVQVNAGYRYQF